MGAAMENPSIKVLLQLFEVKRSYILQN